MGPGRSLGHSLGNQQFPVKDEEAAQQEARRQEEAGRRQLNLSARRARAGIGLSCFSLVDLLGQRRSDVTGARWC
jgi:hypothetical protein